MIGEKPISPEDRIWIKKIYHEAFPKFVGPIKIIEEKDWQERGVDLLLYMKDEHSIMIDEKIRHCDYPDLLCEDYSCLEHRTPGWTRDWYKITDFISYINLPRHEIWIIDYKALRKFFLDNYNAIYPLKHCQAETPGDNGCILYHTDNIAIPLNFFPETWKAENFWRYCS